MSYDFISSLYTSHHLAHHDDYYYNKIIQDIEHEGVESQVYYLLKKKGILEKTPIFFQAFLKEKYDKGLFMNLFIKNQTDMVLAKFEEQGIDVIPLKGVYFAEKYFGQIGARATSDIDLLVRFQDLSQAIETVKALGFKTEEEPIPGHFHCSFSKKLPHSAVPLVVEIHWGLVKEDTSEFDINDIWRQAKTVGENKYIRELSDLHCFYLICLHGWRHNLSSLKYFIDIMQMIHGLGSELDFCELFRLAESHQTLKRITRTLSIVYEEFPHLDQVVKLPLKRKSRNRKQSNTKGLKEYIDFVDYQFFSYDTFKHSIHEICHWLIPSKFELSQELNEDTQEISLTSYVNLYKKRITGILRGLFLGKIIKK
jgi:hypothetical protein